MYLFIYTVGRGGATKPRFLLSPQIEQQLGRRPSVGLRAPGCRLRQMAGVRIAFPGSFSANRFGLPMSARFLTRVDSHSYSLLARLPANGGSKNRVSRFVFRKSILIANERALS